MLKLFKPYVSWRSVWNVVRVLFSGQLAEGPEVKKFEEEFATFIDLNPEMVVAVNSGTSALELAAHMLDLKPGDEVVVPVLTCAATVTPFARRGCAIVYADIDDDLNVDIEDVLRKITKKTKAVVGVAFGGNTARMSSLSMECSARRIPFVYDAAQAVEGILTAARFTCVSLQATKLLTSGDGGFLVCKQLSDAKRARKLRWFGLERGKPLDQQTISEPGYKFHMNDIAAAIGRANLKALPKLIAHRKKLAAVYREADGFAHQWLAGFVSKLEPMNPDLVRELVRSGYGFEIGQHHYRQDKHGVPGRGECPNMDRLEGRYWFIPYGHHVSVRQAKRIANALK